VILGTHFFNESQHWGVKKLSAISCQSQAVSSKLSAVSLKVFRGFLLLAICLIHLSEQLKAKGEQPVASNRQPISNNQLESRITNTQHPYTSPSK
jgi:hypothetical protein